MNKRKMKLLIEYIEYIVIGLTLGLIISYVLEIHPLNGGCIGLSFGILFQKTVQEKKLLLSIYILVGLIIGGLIAFIFTNNIKITIFGMSLGMFVGTILYLINPISRSRIDLKKENQLTLLIYIILGIVFGGLIGYMIFKPLGASFGIAIGMISGISYYIKNSNVNSKKKKKIK